MTLSTTTSKIIYNGNSSTTVFSFPYYFLSNSDLVVVLTSSTGVETVQTITTHYSVTGAGEPSGGEVTMVTAPATGQKLTIYRSVALTQQTDYAENSTFPAESHEAALDKLTMVDQQLSERLDRTLLLPVSLSGFTSTLPSPPANYYVKVNAAGTAFEFGSGVGGGAITAIDGIPIGAVTPSTGAFTSLISRQSGGTPGSDEIEITHTGSLGKINCKDGNIDIYGGSAKLASFINNDVNAVNYLQFDASNTGTAPALMSNGTDTNVALSYQTKGTGSHQFFTNTSTRQFQVNNVASAVNYVAVGGSPTTVGVPIAAEGTDTNIDILLVPKGTATVQVIGSLSVTGTSNIGNLILLSSQTASNVAQIDFTSLITSTYSSYIFELFDVVPATDNRPLWMLTSTDNGANYDTGASDYSYAFYGYNASATLQGASNAASEIPLGENVGNAANESAAYTIKLINPLDTTKFKAIKFDSTVLDISTLIRQVTGGAFRRSTADITAVRFKFSSGNISSGTFKMYGVK